MGERDFFLKLTILYDQQVKGESEVEHYRVVQKKPINKHKTLNSCLEILFSGQNNFW